MSAVVNLAGAAWLKDPRLVAIFTAIEAAGGEARVVGGAVRSAVAGEPVGDIDVATTLPPQAVVAAAHDAGLKVHETGLKHGTVTLVAGDAGACLAVEVTSLRVDVETDGRHAKVTYTDDWTLDAGRRDFTVNAVYADRHGNLFDPLGGIADIVARRVRFVGSAQERIGEDYLRILRFFRISAEFAQGPFDAAGLAAAEREAAGLKRLSRERITKEMSRLLVAARADEAVAAMAAHGVLEQVCAGKGDVDRFQHMVAIDRRHGITADWLLRLAALFGVDDSLRQAFVLSNEHGRRLAVLRNATALDPTMDEARRREAAYRLGKQGFADCVRLAWADGERNGDRDDRWKELYTFATTWRAPPFPVRGRDLVALGHVPGPGLGEALRRLEEEWIAGGFSASREELLDRARPQRSHGLKG